MHRPRAAGKALLCSVLAACLFAPSAWSADRTDALALLQAADAVKTSDHARFVEMLQTVGRDVDALAEAERQYLEYLRGWKHAYDGDYDAALATLTPLAGSGLDPTLRFRATASLVNVHVLARHYAPAFQRLNQLLDQLPDVTDSAAREQALGIAAHLYNEVGEYDVALVYADKLIEENWAGRGACNGGQLRIEALFKSGRMQTVGPELEAAVNACIALGEPVYANAIRTYAARLLLAQGRYAAALRLLNAHYQEAVATGYPRLIAEFDALLATAYRETGDAQRVREYALRAIKNGVKDQYTDPLITAYRLLYVIAKERGDTREALAYHEKYAAADKGYLDDVSARQLAYQRVSHDALADKLRIDALNKENEVLQLQRALDRKAFETLSLYVVLLILVIVSVAFWAYRTKRLQLHFMRLSQIDGLTGIANRPRFIELAESALANARRAGQEACVVLCDLDHFKSINDQHGHAAGDLVLKHTVAACEKRLRSSDVFGRFGGEEFGFVLPGCSLQDAKLRAEELRLAIAAISGPSGRSVSASFGVASTASAGYELRRLLARADAALYRAKHAGRNRVVADEPSQPAEPPEALASA